MLRQLLKDRCLIQRCNLIRYSSSARSLLSIELLKTRSVLKVSGDDAAGFMQGLITNDMQHLKDGASSMYTMFLNTKGRVMYDAIIYRTQEDNSYLVECDQSALPALQNHLSLYRVRRIINIDNLEDTMNVWALFNAKLPVPEDTLYVAQNKMVGEIGITCSVIDDNEVTLVESEKSVPEFKDEHNLIVCRDPRLAALGFRILAPKDKDMIKIATTEIGADIPSNEDSYKLARYKLGVGEGIQDLPPGKTFPLEANCDYLHGVSFHKGCYIGQELTARTHHTGVIRKRLMPLDFDYFPGTDFMPDEPIKLENNCSRAVGKLRSVKHLSGIGLLRINEALEAPLMKVLGVTCQTRKPFWWPHEASKERIIKAKDTIT